ncbi:MAG: thiamine monophosphate kinase [Pseudomonadota bacterium]
MALGEFDLIATCFSRPTPRAVLGGGDDCALLAPRAGHHWAVSTDTLVEGRHFLSTVAPAALGHKALAVNLSDLAACGAEPVACTLALTLPRIDLPWVQALADGLYTLADAHGIELVGGDTTGGPLALTLTVMGEVPAGQALRRDGARPGDALWVSHPADGGIGDARLALEVFRGTLSLPGEDFARVRQAMEWPQPRVALGRGLRGLATAAIDLSDGLAGDLGHVLTRSGVGATIEAAALPRSPVLAAQTEAWQRCALLHGGDDYELLFCTADDAATHDQVRQRAEALGLGCRRIGRIDAEPGLRLQEADGRCAPLTARAWDHFSGAAT